MPNGQHAKASRDLAYVTEQIRSGKTRSGRELSKEEMEVLEEKRDTLKQQIEDQRAARVNSHTTTEANRVIEATKTAVQE